MAYLAIPGPQDLERSRETCSPACRAFPSCASRVVGALGYAGRCRRLWLMTHRAGLGSLFRPGGFLALSPLCFTWLGNRYFTFAATPRARPVGASRGNGCDFMAANVVGGWSITALSSLLVRFAPPLVNNLLSPGVRRAGRAGVQFHPVQQAGVQRPDLGRSQARAFSPLAHRICSRTSCTGLLGPI